MKIAVTFSGLEPHRLAEHVERRLRERRASHATAAARPINDAETSSPSRPAGRPPRRDRKR